MGRNISDTIEYFSHYVDHGKTVYILERKFGNDGYAVFFKLFELLGKSDRHVISFRDEMEFEYMIAHFNTDEQTVINILDTLAKLGKIDPELYEAKVIWYQNFVDNQAHVYKKRRRELPQKPTLESISVTEKGLLEQKQPEMTQIQQSATETIQSIVEDSKEENRKEESEVLTASQEQAILVCEYLIEMIIENNPDHKYSRNKPKVKSKNWMGQIDLAIRKDGYSVEHLKNIITYTFTKNTKNAQFWAATVQSGKSLRNGFEQMRKQYNDEKHINQKTDGTTTKASGREHRQGYNAEG